MRVLLDECLPAELADELVGYEVRTVQQEGWSSVENGPLLSLASGQNLHPLHPRTNRDRSRDLQWPPLSRDLPRVLVSNSIEFLSAEEGPARRAPIPEPVERQWSRAIRELRQCLHGPVPSPD